MATETSTTTILEDVGINASKLLCRCVGESVVEVGVMAHLSVRWYGVVLGAIEVVRFVAKLEDKIRASGGITPGDLAQEDVVPVVAGRATRRALPSSRGL